MKNLYFMLLVSFLMAGCEQESGEPGGRVEVQFQASGISQTRITEDGLHWKQDDRIGVFMKRPGELLSASAIIEGANNIQYRAVDDDYHVSGFSPVGSTIFYPQDGSLVDFIAYYPYKDNLMGFTYPVDVTDQSDPAAIDLLCSRHPDYYDKNSVVIDLSFERYLSKVTINLTPGEGSPDLAGCRVEFRNVPIRGEFLLAAGSVASDGARGSFTAYRKSDTEHSAILIPCSASGSSLRVVLADGQSRFDWDFPVNEEFERAWHYTYNIVVSKTGITVTSEDIVPWEGKDDAPIESMARSVRYKVGDYYPYPSVVYDPSSPGTVVSGTEAIGLVFWLDDQHPGYNAANKTGTSGKIVGLKESSLTWGPLSVQTGAEDEADGIRNMGIITAIANWRTDFPTFGWVDGLNPAGTVYSSDIRNVWYLPSIDELEQLYIVWNSDRTGFNEILRSAGGQILEHYFDPLYWSSTEFEFLTQTAWVVDFSNGVKENSYNKTNIERIRPVMAF